MSDRGGQARQLSGVMEIESRLFDAITSKRNETIENILSILKAENAAHHLQTWSRSVGYNVATWAILMSNDDALCKILDFTNGFKCGDNKDGNLLG